ncbi:hypothetical protein CECT5772_10928 [Streptococcus equi subsp. ruminatorum CECT 5772]|uniref:Uncharacterized protein n=1 Tax=Streptococcus equi subsp. ruminatorum CECT 5772 TaxID=1051981 RepID=A0A922T1D8_9STRE|nr:hypothetical protein CECT5772_10928 [Streptococcus equi subsp. ruminatorum CECT 5772]
MRGDEGCLLFCDVQSEEDAFLEVIKVHVTKRLALDIFDQFVNCFKLSVRISSSMALVISSL